MDGLSSEQVKDLAQYLLDKYGPDLTSQRLIECVPLVLEDIAGYEVVDDEEIQFILNQVGEIYDGLINERAHLQGDYA